MTASVGAPGVLRDVQMQIHLHFYMHLHMHTHVPCLAARPACSSTRMRGM